MGIPTLPAPLQSDNPLGKVDYEFKRFGDGWDETTPNSGMGPAGDPPKQDMNPMARMKGSGDPELEDNKY
jgi:hypothetical protein